MTLREAIAMLDDLDEEATLYVEGSSEEWHPNSDTSVGVAEIIEDDNTGAIDEVLPEEAAGKTYFLEVRIAKEILAGWESHLDHPASLEERVDRVIYYARFDA